ncbi:Ig-domain containing protein [Klebsiella phage Muenster]|nr:Ig-domain containing protein [Klebsiella phage Muenster]
MARVIAKQNHYPFVVDGLKVTAANVNGTVHVGDLFVYKQRTFDVYDLISTDGTVYTFIRLVHRDSNLVALKYSDADEDIADSLAVNTFCIKESDPKTGVEGFSILYQLNKVKLDNGGFIFRRTNVKPPVVHVESVTVSPKTLTGAVGGTEQLSISVLPLDATDKSVTWSSSAESVCTVDSAGLVSYVATGTATITVTTNDGNKTDTVEVTVE